VPAAQSGAAGAKGASGRARTQEAAATQPATRPAALAHGAPGQPIVIGSANVLAIADQVMALLRSGQDPVSAVVTGVNQVEDDPKDHSVGYGGLPNEDGVVELDASVMDGRTHRAGAVAALQKIRNPSSVAKMVMRYTDHVLLVGEGALKFAKAVGFKEQDLLTDEAREIWLKWKTTHSSDDDWVYPEASDEAARRLRQMGIDFTYGTINCLAMTAKGDIGGCTSTSGLSYKLPGRVGDSPIVGAGLYVDNEVGAAGSTGRGEANLQNCSSVQIVELMRSGMNPTEACLEALRRVAKRTEKRLRNAKGEPDFGLSFYALRKDGQIGGASMRSGEKGPPEMAVHDGRAARLVGMAVLYT
jgi:N4-(beta-N-acetylglucosaminyl)-L-asparaginase